MSLGHMSSGHRVQSKESGIRERRAIIHSNKQKKRWKWEIYLTEHNPPVLLLTSPSAQVTQSKQQTGFPFLLATRFPGGQLSLHTDRTAWEAKQGHSERDLGWIQLIYFCLVAGKCTFTLIFIKPSSLEKALWWTIAAVLPTVWWNKHDRLYLRKTNLY